MMKWKEAKKVVRKHVNIEEKVLSDLKKQHDQSEQSDLRIKHVGNKPYIYIAKLV